MKNIVMTWLYRFVVITLLSGIFYSKVDNKNVDALDIKIDSLIMKTNIMQNQIDSLQMMHPWKTPSKKMSQKCVSGTFLGFALWGTKNTNIHDDLEEALISYSGPKVKITSLRRHWGTSSKHECGKAVDMEFCHDLIDWLVSEQGQSWCETHNLKFYIEAKPKAKVLQPYKSSEVYAAYVFENPHATGPHIHIEIA